jgi:hypothetical protein
MRAGRGLPAALLVGALALAGCSHQPPTASGSSSGTPTASPSTATSSTATSSPATASPSASPSAAPTPRNYFPRSTTAAAALHVAALETSVARTAEEKAVVSAWMAYWQAATDAYYERSIVPGLATTATGAARAAVDDNLADLRRSQQRGVGWSRDNVTSVTVSGDTATVRDCTENYTFNVDADGDAVTNPVPYYDARGRLVKRDGRWYVTSASSAKLTKSCL